jgi:hypothetical protein
MLSAAEKAGWDKIDEVAEQAGGYLATPKRPLIVDYDYREMAKYCFEKGISNADLTEEELKMFEYDEPLVYA